MTTLLDTSTNVPDAGVAGEFLLDGVTPVTRMGFGAMQLAGPEVWGPPKDRAGAIAVVRRAVELGVRHIDTSDYYGPHVVNEIIREALHPYPDDLLIATKVGAYRTPDRGWPAALTPTKLRTAVHDNLRRLRRDRLDLVNLRIVAESGGLSPTDSIAVQVETLAELRDQGLIRHIGMSNVSLQQFLEAQTIVPVVAVQNEYNLLRRHDEDLLAATAASGVAFTPFFPLGTFTLTHDRDPNEEAKRPQAGVLGGTALNQVAARHAATVYQVALAWLLARSTNILCIPGTSSLTHLEQNIAAVTLRLTPADLRDLDSLAG